MPDPKNPRENQPQGGEELPGTDFYESEAQEDERSRGQNIGHTFEEEDRHRREEESGKQAT